MIIERVNPHLLQGQILLQVEVSMPPDLLIRYTIQGASPGASDLCVLSYKSHLFYLGLLVNFPGMREKLQKKQRN